MRPTVFLNYSSFDVAVFLQMTVTREKKRERERERERKTKDS